MQIHEKVICVVGRVCYTDAQCVIGGIFIFVNIGPTFRDDDTGLRRSSCVMVVIEFFKYLWSFVFAFQRACKSRLLCTVA